VAIHCQFLFIVTGLKTTCSWDCLDDHSE